MRKNCKRKVWPLVNTINHAITGAGLTQGPQLDLLRMHELSAIESFRTGKATVDDWAKIVGMLNLCENMASNGIGQEALPVCQDAHNHLIEAAKRYETTKRMGITGPGLQCIRDLYEFHDLQRTSVSRSVYERMIKETSDRVKSKAPEVVDVLETHL